jgi:hypothetical protein
MTRRTGEIDLARLKREWPRYVALAIGKVRGLANSEVYAALLMPCRLRRERTPFAVAP